jgi:hypothetical protein
MLCLIVVFLMAAGPVAAVAAICAYSPVMDRLREPRLLRDREIDRFARHYQMHRTEMYWQPGRALRWTPDGFRPVPVMVGRG